MIAITIYIVGYVVAYAVVKWSRSNNGLKQEWSYVFLTLMLSLGSWFTVVMFIAAFIVENVKNNETKPPKWL